jgi:hypothetical protein
LWAALAYAAGLVIGIYAWRPPLWWMVAFIVFNVQQYISCAAELKLHLRLG